MTPHCQTLEDFIRALHTHGVDEVSILGRVATSTSPGGKEVTFRGRITVSAGLAAGEFIEYEERAPQLVTQTEAPDLPPTPDQAQALSQARQALVGQLQAYRKEYRSVMEAARSRLAEKLQQAGLSVTQAES